MTDAPEKPDVPSRRKTALWLAAILLAAVAARAAVFRGYAASDDAGYAAVAWELAEGRFPPEVDHAPVHYATRLGLVAPVALLFRLFGVSEITLLVVPVAFSAAMLALVFFATRMFFSLRAAIIAAAIYAVVPIDCRFATWLLSDIPAHFWAGAGIVILYKGQRAEAVRAKLAAGFAASLFFGLSWLTRSQVAHMAPFVLGALLIWCRRDKGNLWLALSCVAGALCIFAAEGLVYYRVHGGFLYRLHAIQELYETDPNWYFREGSPFGWERGGYAWGLLRRLLKYGPAAIMFNPNFGLVPLVAVIASIHVVRFGRREFFFPAAWFLYAVAFFNFGSASLEHYEPLAWVDAYLMPILLPGVIVAGGWLARMLPQPGMAETPRLTAERRFWAALACITIMFGCSFGLFQHARQGVGCPVIRRVAESIKPGDVVYTDPKSREALRFFRGYRQGAGIGSFTGMSAADLPGNAKILINPHQLRRLADLAGYDAPDYVKAVPREWRVAWRQAGAVLYALPSKQATAP